MGKEERNDGLLKHIAMLFLLDDVPDRVNSLPLLTNELFCLGSMHWGPDFYFFLRAKGPKLSSDLGFLPRNIFFSNFSITFPRVSNF